MVYVYRAENHIKRKRQSWRNDYAKAIQLSRNRGKYICREVKYI